MNCNDNFRVPPRWARVYSVWYRHVRVYNANFFSNAFAPFLEPLIFLAGLGLGLGGYLQDFGGMNYLLFLAGGLPMTSSMFTGAYECTFGTFVRLEFDKVYDGMLGAPLSPGDLMLGELLFAAGKGFFFALAVLFITWITGIITYPLSVLVPLMGFLCALMFAALSMFVTTFVKNMNHFSFYFTGLLSPMFFFSGVVFPVENLPGVLQYVAEIVPLTHAVRLSRALCVPDQLSFVLLFDLLYIILFTAFFGRFAVERMKRRLID